MTRTEIPASTYSEHMGHDLREAFEILGASQYLEVINTLNAEGTTIIGRLVTFNDRSGCYNMSEVFAHDGLEYGYAREIREGCATETFFTYDSIDAARTHAIEILNQVTGDV